MKRIHSGARPIVYALVAMFAAACQTDASPSPKNGSQAKRPAGEPLRVGFLLKTMQEERYQRDKGYFLARAAQLGAEVMFESANNDEQIQLAKLENMIAKGCQVIVLQPVNTGTAGNMVRMANREGIKVIGYDSMLVNGPLDLMVMQDSWAVGQLQGQALLAWLRQRGKADVANVVLIKGQPGDSNAIAMSSGAQEIIAQYPKLNLVAEQWHEGWSPDKAMATAENVLTKYQNRVDAFICNNSGMARGVIAALEAVGLASSDRVFVAGSDADLINVQYVAQGKQTVEIWKKIRPLAERAAELAVQLAKGEAVSADKLIDNGHMRVPTIVTPVVLVTRDNIDQTVVADGFFSKQQIYGS